MTQKLRAVGYARVSTALQADEGLSLDEQERSIGRYVEAQDWEHVETFTERGVSGAVPFADRPEFARLLDRLDGIDRIVIPKLDRLGRSTKDLLALFEQVEAAGAAVVSLSEGIDTSTPVGKLTRTVLAAIAEFERDRLKERVADVTEARARKGGWHGGPRPFGYDCPPGGGLVENPAEAAIVRRIFAEYVAGISQRQIARNLNADGVRPKNAGLWIQGTLSNMLANPVYAGLVHLKGKTYDGDHEAIVDADLWRKAEQLRQAGTRSDGGRGRTPKANHVLAGGLLRCGRCGSAMGAVTKPTRTPGALYERYQCSGRLQYGSDRCSQQPVERGPIDTAVWRFFEKVALDVDATKAALADQHDAKLAEIDALRAQADREAQRAEARLARVRRDYQDDKLDADDWREQRGLLTAELEAATSQADRFDRHRAALTDEMAQIDAESAVLEQIAALRAMVVGEVREGGRESVDAFRAALRRLFTGFELMTSERPFGTRPDDDGIPWPHPDLNLGGGDEWMVLLPRLRRDAVVDWWDGEVEFPALRRAALTLRESNRNGFTR